VSGTSSPSGPPGSHDVAAALRVLRSFAATVALGPDSDNDDLLATRERAIPWLRAQGLMPADAMLTGSEHGALLRLRDALRDALAAHAARGGAAGGGAAGGGAAGGGAAGGGAEVAARLTRALADGRLVVTITEAGSVKLATAARSVYPSVVAAIAVAIAEADAAGAWLSLTPPAPPHPSDPPREPDPVAR
jgi:hypothetical protein